jgi:argininosuccinate synthase
VCLERDLARFKRMASQRWTELVYDGLWFSPLRASLEAFMTEASKNVTGDVRVRLQAGQAVVTGRRSPAALYDYGLATYDTGDVFDQQLAKGFVELWGLPTKVAAERDRNVALA